MSTNINNTKAIVLILLGMTVFAIQDTLIKLTSDNINLYLIYFVRCIVGLIVIMTSNFKNNLDEALIRPGRIDKIIHYDYIKKEQDPGMISDIESAEKN